jgi:iron complex outermembrane receptor protein
MVVQGNVSRARRGTASRRKLAVLLGEVAAIALMAWSLPAVAAEADEAKATAGDEIIVTARRREENIQSVPVAVTAVTPTVLTEQHIVQASDLQVLAPSLTVTASSVSQGQSGSFNIRGQGQTFGGALPSVITYFAEVPLESQGGAAFGLYDIDSVQVVRGPQGTLFGRNTVGGAVLISPTAPKSEFGGYIDATFGNYGAREFKGAVDVPLGSTLSLRLAGNSVRRDDLTKNLTGHDFGNRHSDAWRVFLRWEPSTSFRNDLVYNGSYADEHGDAFVLSGLRPDKTAYIYNGGSRTATTLVPGSMVAEFQAQQLRGPRVVSDSQEGLGARRNIHLIVNTSTLKFGDASLKNIISYERVKVCYGSDLDGVDTRNSVSTCFPSTIGTNAGVASDPDVNLRQFTEELQLSGTAFDKMLDYQVGGFLLSASSPGGLDTFRVNRVTFSPSGQNLLYNLTVNQFADKSRGIYTQNTLHLGAERNISITAGLRYSWDTREASFGRLVSSPQTYNAPPPPFSSFGCTLPGVGASPATPATQCYRRLKNDYNGLSYTFGADWKVTPAVLLYATTRHSFKDGGFNTVVASGNNPAYDPEKATDYEIGL